MLFDTSSAELALDTLLAFSYQPPDTTPIFLGGYLSNCPSRKSELNNAVRELEQTAAAVSKLELKVALLQTRLRNHVAVIKRALCAAAVLPTELLCEIFRLVADGDGSSRARIALSHVSRRWRDIAIAIPELWTVIETRPGCMGQADMLREFGRRAGSLELHISSRQTYRDFPKKLDISFSDRCTELSLLGDVSHSALQSLIPFNYHKNNIRELNLEAPQHWFVTPPMFEVGIELPACRTMRLNGVKLPDLGSRLRLTVLHVENMGIHDFRDVICTWHCNALEELHVFNIWVDDEDDDDVDASALEIVQRLLRLKLEHIEIKGCRPDMLDVLFRNWSIPLPPSVVIQLDPKPFGRELNAEERDFLRPLLNVLTEYADNMWSLELSGSVPWFLDLIESPPEANNPVVPSLVDLTLRSPRPAAKSSFDSPQYRRKGQWALELLAYRHSDANLDTAEFACLETLTISEWLMKGHEDSIRKHGVELVLLPDADWRNSI